MATVADRGNPDLAYRTQVKLWANWKDVWNTMLAPTVLVLIARYTRVFGGR